MFKETKSQQMPVHKNLNDIFSEAKGSSYFGPIMEKMYEKPNYTQHRQTAQNKQDGPNTQLPGQRGHSKTLCVYSRPHNSCPKDILYL